MLGVAFRGVIEMLENLSVARAQSSSRLRILIFCITPMVPPSLVPIPSVPMFIIGMQKHLREAALASRPRNPQACHIQSNNPRPSTSHEGKIVGEILYALSDVERSALYDKPSVE